MSTADPNGLYTLAQSAESILLGLISISSEWKTEGNLHLQISTNISGLDCGVQLPREGNLGDAIASFHTKVENRPTILCTSATLYLQMPQLGGQSEQSRIQYSTDNGVVGKFLLKLANCPEDVTAITDALVSNFKVTNYLDLARTQSPSIDDAALQLRERSVADLKEQVAKLAEFLTGMAGREAENREKLQTKLEESHQERSDKLEAEYRKRKQDFEQLIVIEQAKVEAARNEVDEKRRALDLRDEQGVRRELLDKIQTVLKDAEVHSASKSTQDKRFPIQCVAFGMMAVGAIIAGLSGYRAFNSGTVDWHFWVVFASSVATMISTAIYYLKWTDRWFREHADAEFAAKRYKADILRASWLAELAGEWKKTKDGEALSPLLIEAFSRNLFANVSISNPSEHPLDEVTNLLKRATEVNFGKSGFSLKGIKSSEKSED